MLWCWKLYLKVLCQLSDFRVVETGEMIWTQVHAFSIFIPYTPPPSLCASSLVPSAHHRPPPSHRHTPGAFQNARAGSRRRENARISFGDLNGWMARQRRQQRAVAVRPKRCFVLVGEESYLSTKFIAHSRFHSAGAYICWLNSNLLVVAFKGKVLKKYLVLSSELASSVIIYLGKIDCRY